MKLSKAHFESRVHKIPELRFEDQRLTSYAGMVIVQALIDRLELRSRLKKCFEHIAERSVIGFHVIILVVIFHVMLGFKRLRDIERYRDDQIVLRALHLRKMPDVSTVCRTLSKSDVDSVNNVRLLSREIVRNRIEKLDLKRYTIDFDGSVLSTTRQAEGTAVGYNKKKKGARSYYPLFCTIAQTAEVFDFYHRPGNVHDSNGAKTFISDCVKVLKSGNEHITLESRLDCAFFSDEIVEMLDFERVFFTISVPFERFSDLKSMVESRRRWKRLDRNWSYFESDWSPDCWSKKYRFIFLKQKVKKHDKEPIQLELFRPTEYGYDFKVIVTNMECSTKKVLQFHNGRGAQENIFSELKTHCQMDYIPVKRLTGNQLYMTSAVISHNLFREMQMETFEQDRKTEPKRAPLWIFKEAKTIRQHLLHIAGRLTRPGGKLRLTLSGNSVIRQTFLRFLNKINPQLQTF